MRIFKFRGYSEAYGWVEGCLDVYQNRNGIECAYIRTDDGHICKVHPNSIGEFVNRYDTDSGRRVFEGDIVELALPHYNAHGKVELGVVADHGRYLLMYGYNTPIDGMRFKVVGNVYENLDMLSPENQRYIKVFHFKEDEEVD